MEKYFSEQPRDFLAVATPGAGKTTFALSVAAELLGRRLIDRVTVVAPTEHLKTQWAQAAERAGIPIDPTYAAGKGRTSQDYVGIAVTYAGVAVNPLAMRIRTERFKTLVILDEVHHAGDALSWGEGVREAFEPATRRLALTGTPFRSDVNPIPFVTYAPGPDGIPRSAADYTYGYSHALADHVVRPVLFLAYSGEMSWRTRAGDEIAARLGEPLTKDLTNQALRTALDPEGSWIPSVLAAADKRLSEVRRHVPDAGGLVIATDQDSARSYAKTLRKITGEAADRGALRREGGLEEDQRLRRRRVALDGRGADGLRGRRRAPPGRRRLGHHHLDAAVLRPGRRAASCAPGPAARSPRSSCPRCRGCSPSPPRWRSSATTCWAARSPTRTTSSPPRTTCWPRPTPASRPPPTSSRCRSRRSARRPASTTCSTTAPPSATRARCRSAPRRRWTSSASPVCSSPARCATCCASASPTGPASRSPPPRRPPAAPSVEQVSTHEQLAVLRRELNGLVAAWFHRTGQAHGITHAALRKECGGPAAAIANAEQLRARIDRVREWAARKSG